MSFDEKILVKILKGISKVHLETILIGSAAAALHEVPITTQDVDFFVRNTERNLEKIKLFAKQIDGIVTRPYEPVSKMIRVISPDVSVDFVFQISSQKKFESVRAKSVRMNFPGVQVQVAALEDVLAAKEAADRPKDRATIPLLKSTLEVKKTLRNQKG